MRWEDDHEWWVKKDLEGGGHCLFDGTILEFMWRDWGNSWIANTVVKNRVPPECRCRLLPHTSLGVKKLENMALLAYHYSPRNQSVSRNKHCVYIILLSGWQMQSIQEENSWFSSSVKSVMWNRERWKRRKLLWSSYPISLIIALILLTMHWTKAVTWLYFTAKGRFELATNMYRCICYSWKTHFVMIRMVVSNLRCGICIVTFYKYEDDCLLGCCTM